MQLFYQGEECFTAPPALIMKGMCLKGQTTATPSAGFQSCSTHAVIYAIIKIINGASALLPSAYLAHQLIHTPSPSIVLLLPPTGWLIGIQQARGFYPGFADAAEVEGRFPLVPGQINTLPVSLTYSRSCAHTNIITS